MPKLLAPEGYSIVMPYLRVRGAADAVQFYKDAFGAKQKLRLDMADGRVGHAEVSIAGGVVMLSDEFPELGITGPQSLNGTTVTIALYVADVDKTAAKAVAAGARLLSAPKDEFYGDRTARIEDPFGHVWSLQKQNEKLTQRQMQKRLDALLAVSSHPKSAAKPTPRKAK